MTDSIYEFVMANLDATRGNWQAVADGCGLSKSTIVKIGCRIVKDPGVSRVEILAKYFRENPPSLPKKKLRRAS